MSAMEAVSETAETPAEIDMAQVTLKMNAGRVVAVDKYPYMHAALFSMVPVAVRGLGTFASDIKWRMYYDPEFVLSLDVQQIAAVLMHEVGHCVRGHGERFRDMGHSPMYAKIYNIAGDVCINEDLREDGLQLPENGVFLNTLIEDGIPVTRKMSAEQVYALLKAKVEDESCSCGSAGDSSENSDSGESGEQGQQDGDGEQDGAGASGSGSESGESGEQSNDGSGSGAGESGAGESGAGGAGGRDPNCPLHGDPKPGGANGNGPDGNNGLPMEGWDCGSAADGVARDYEIEGGKVDAGVDEERADVVRRTVAKEIREHSAARGNVPGSWKRWSDEILDPVVDWRKEFASIVRRAYASVAGQRDYTYSRQSRRQSAMNQTGQGIVLPAMRAPEPPKVTLVFDTSGSMSDDMIAWSLAECKGILRGLGSSGRSVNVIACDAVASDTQRVTRVENVDLSGGGGTDMRVGIAAAMESREKPEVIVVLTDGYTPWPDEQIKGVTLIAALTTEGAADQVPEWARKVVITRDDQ